MKKLVVSILCILLFAAAPAFAKELGPYSEAAFSQAKKEGKTLLLDFHAPWCPVCQRQEPVLQKLLDRPEFGHIVALKVDYDWVPELKKELGVSRQSTLVVFKGSSEVSRLVGSTEAHEIETLLRQAL